MTRTKDILFITAIIVVGIGLGLLLNHFIPFNYTRRSGHTHYI